jgi:hypothetical protein
VFKQGNASEKTPMIDLSSSSDEEKFIDDTFHDAELAKKLFGDLNHDILMPPGDGKIIVLDDSDDKTEKHEEKTADIEPTTAPASTDPASSAPISGCSTSEHASRTPLMHCSTFSLFLLCPL